MNKELWTAEISKQSPCGDDLEYDAEFMALWQAVQGKPEQQFGETIIPAEEPNWQEIERLAEALLQRTKDIRVCVLLTRACTRNHGLPGLVAGLQSIHLLLDRYWEQIHPRLVIDGDEDPFIRANAIAGLADRMGLIRDIRQAVLVNTPVGPILVKDAEAALDKGKSSGSGYSSEQLIAICEDASIATQSGLTAIADASRALMDISQLCDERFGSQYPPDISFLSGMLSNLSKILINNRTREVAAKDDPVSAPDIEPPPSQMQKAISVLDIHSREDAIRALEMVCHYIEKNEPTNPAPLLIKRAQRLMSLGFVEIIKELAPDSLGHIEVITGIRRE